MLPKPIAHWILGHISRETLKWMIGGFLLIPMVIGPIIVVVALFVGLRKVRPTSKTGLMLTWIGNAILASLFFLGMIWPDDWQLLSPPPPASVEPSPFYHAMVAWVICIWFLSAAFLFLRSRLAWIGSLLGVGSAIFLFVCLLISVVRECLFSDAAKNVAPSLVSFLMGMVSMMGFLIGCLAISVAVFIGLVKNRRELRRI